MAYTSSVLRTTEVRSYTRLVVNALRDRCAAGKISTRTSMLATSVLYSGRSSPGLSGPGSGLHSVQ